MQTSRRGIAFIEQQEGVVLRAYRDVAGVWTIGAGLTKASGVVSPRAGQVITREEASDLLKRALARNYELDVARVMPGAAQHQFDGGTSFHFNTGAIGRASWVRSWVERDWPAVQTGLASWSRAGGKVVRGLQRRRAAEFELIRRGHYGAVTSVYRVPSQPDFAKWAPVSISAAEREETRRALAALGYDAGTTPGEVKQAAARSFQTDHALTNDGIVGPATRATVKRMMNARQRFALAGAGTAVPAATATQLPDDMAVGGSPWLLIVPGLLWLGWLAFTHRDAIAVLLQRRTPRLAAYLRSF